MTLDDSKSRFFLALLPPLEIQDDANQIKEHFAQNYNSRAAQKSPPHITLQPPFEWQSFDLPVLKQALASFAAIQKPVPITLNGFGAFPPRVIYINVRKTTQLLVLQQDLMAYCEASLGIVDPVSKNRPFSPHLTVAFRDLTKQHFDGAWAEWETRQLDYQFMASQLTLLIHDGKRWNVSAEFPFLATY
jgi:2'-5' RNA ligase